MQGDVSDEWYNVWALLKWVLTQEELPENATLIKIDSSLPWGATNARFVTFLPFGKESFVEFEGKTMRKIDCWFANGITCRNTFNRRLVRGKTLQEALLKPPAYYGTVSKSLSEKRAQK